MLDGRKWIQTCAAAAALAVTAASAETPPAALSSAAAEMRDPLLSPFDYERLHAPPPAPPLAPPIRIGDRPPPPPPIDAGIRLEGLIDVDARAPRAIVSGRIVGVGDRIGKVRVVAIGTDWVKFARGSRTFKKRWRP